MLLGILLTISWLLLAQMISSEHLCDDGGQIETHSFNERDNTKPQNFTSTSTSTNTSEEWIFEDATDGFLTVEFTQFDLSGPICDEEAEGYSTVKIETTLSVVQPYYLYCKGRRSPVGDPISSMGRLRIAYCNQHPNGKIQFQVIPGCNATLIARKTHTQLSVKKSKMICSIHLKSLGSSGINLKLSEVSTKVNKKRCQRAFISVKESKVNMQKSLFHDDKERICSVDGQKPIEETYDFQTLMQDIIITYKNSAFTLKFMELPLNETATIATIASKIGVDVQETTGRSINGSGRTNDSLLIDQVMKGQGSMPLIIALGCGGLLIILAIIATLVYLKRRTTKSRSSKESVKRRTTGSSAISEDIALVRAQSVCSIDNAMYGRVVSGGGTAETMTDDDRRNNSRRQRLAQLEEKYGPFPETSTSFRSPASTENARADAQATIKYYHAQNRDPDSEHKLFKKGIRPLLPLPTVMGNSSPSNEYQTIEEVHQRNTSTVDASNHRLSYFSMTSDEFSDDDVPVAAPIIYATILDGPVSYDQVQEEQRQIPVAEYEPSHSSMQVPEVKYHTKMTTKSLKTPEIDVHPPPISATTALTESTSVLNDIDFQYQTPNRATRRLLVPDENSVKLHGAIREKRRNCVNDHLAPRPSLPEIRQGESFISSVNSLQEDAENYLRPRPSCPDAMIACAYSSTEDLSQIRRRLLAAAHPSLLDSQNHISSNEDVSDEQTKVSYDSPRPSSCNLKPQYVSPRRQDKFNPST